MLGTHGGSEKYIQGFGGGNLKERPLGRLRCRRKDSVKIELIKEIRMM